MGNETSHNNEDRRSDEILLNKRYKYIYARRQCPYRSEQMEMSPKEIKKVKQLQNKSMKYEPYQQILSLSKKKPMKIIIDTDIGTDIDDVFTLLLLSHLPKTDVEILGITTNYRPTILRKHVAESILNQTKHNDHDLSAIPVVAGNCYLCGTHRPFYYAGNEGRGLGLDETDTELMKQLWHNTDTEDAETFIYEQIAKYPKQVTIISIGIPTNIGNLIHKYGKDTVEALIGHMVVMGGGSIMNQRTGFVQKGIGNYYGKDKKKWKTKYDSQTEEIKIEFDLPYDTTQALKWIKSNNEQSEEKHVIHLFPNHNLSGDTLASVMMFSLNCPISLIPHHITRQNILRGTTIETLLLLATKSDLDRKIYEDNENGICASLMREWFRVRRGQRMQCLHDPLTLYEALYCETASTDDKQKSDEEHDEKNEDDGQDFALQKESCLRYCNGTIVVHEWAAFMTFVPDPHGPHRFAYECINPQKWVKWCGDTMINNVKTENVTDNAGDYKTLMNTFAKKQRK